MGVVLSPVRSIVRLTPEGKAPVLLGSPNASPKVVLGPSRGASGSPSGVSGEIQWNNGGVFAGASDAEIEGGQLRLPAIATPAAPAAGGVKLFGRSVGGRILPAAMGPTGLLTALQPDISRNKIAYALPNGNSKVLNLLGLEISGTGTATEKNTATTDLYARMRGIEYLVTTAENSAVSGFRNDAAFYSVGGNDIGLGGFYFVCRWGPATGVALATSRAFVGLHSGTDAPSDTEPSERTNIVGMGWDSTDMNIQFMHNGESGLATKIDLGPSLPRPTADRAHVYECAMFSPSGMTQRVTYEITDLVTGAVAIGTVQASFAPN